MSLEKQPLISIVIANYNYGRFLETAIQSVLRQCDTEMRLPSGEGIELIIVDGGSTDNSVEVIQTYSDRLGGVRFGQWAVGSRQSAVGSGGSNNFRTPELQNSRTRFLWCSEKDKGQSHAFNKGFAHASGRFLTWLNADDILFSNGLAAIAREINKYPDCQWVVGSLFWMDEHLRVIRCFRAHKFSDIRARWGTLSACGPSSFFSRELLEQVGGVDENFHYCMDTDLWHRFYFRARQKYRRTTKIVWGFRIHADSKVSGLDVAPDSEQAYLRRMAQFSEGKAILSKYGKTSSVVWWIDALTTSVTDFIAVWIASRRYIGKMWNEI